MLCVLGDRHGRGLHQSPANNQKQHAHTHARTLTQSEPAAMAVKLCLHGRAGEFTRVSVIARAHVRACTLVHSEHLSD